MARSNLLNTRTATFVDLVGNGKAYTVPPYQRNYSWQEEQWEDLWNDILAMLQAPNERHYMGALVVEAESERHFLIIDGQQRLATLSLLALAVIDTLSETGADEKEIQSNKERSAELRRRFISDKNLASLLDTSKLQLNETNNGFYLDYLVQLRDPINPRGLELSNKLLWNCFTYYKKALLKSFYTGEQLWRLLDEAVGLQLLFILITVDDELSAYTVFETLNARGLELSTTDLLKNWLFSRLREPSDRETLKRQWLRLIGVVQEERFPDFLRYHLLCENAQIRKERLFKMIRAQVRDGREAFDLLSSLEARAELFAAIEDPSHEYWIELPEAKEHIQELKLFRVRQMTPLLFAAWERLSRQDFVRVLKLVVAVAFRHTVIGGRNTNELEPIYHKAAKALLTGQTQTPGGVFEQLGTVWVGDESFRQDFAKISIDTSGQRKKLAKYILCKLESRASGVPCHFETDPGTIEHILPENPDAVWEESFDSKKLNDFTYRLGNLTLLESSLNRRIGIELLAKKALLYEESHYKLTNEIRDETPETWNSDTVESRQRKMAKLAVPIWSSDFS